MNKAKYVMIVLILSSVLLCSCSKNEIPKTGVGMFENASGLEINYNGEAYEIAEISIVNELSQMCDDTDWECLEEEIKKDESDLAIVFVDARATLHVQLEQKVGFINNTAIKIPDNVSNYINEKIVPILKR